MKRVFNYIRNVFIIIASLAAALLLFSQTGIFKELLRDFIVDELSKSINGEISIGKISGNLFSNIEIREINLKGDEPLVAVKKIDVNYSLFSLISDKINVHSLVIDSADLNLVQSKDSSWNISKIFKSSSDTASGLFNWSVFVDEFRINNCLVRISALDSAFPIPKKIENINLSAAGFYTEEMSRFQLKTFSFNASDPEVNLKDFRFSAAGSKNNFHIKDFYLETGLNKIYGEGNIGSDSFDDINIKIRTDPVNISEFGSFTDFRLNKIYPSVFLDINRKDENLFLHAILTEKKQRAEIELKLENTDPIKGIASIKAENLNLAELLEDKSLSGLINCRINIEGF
ncbi:MAG: AsmA family protein, partial [Ignavibacteria bacterium]